MSSQKKKVALSSFWFIIIFTFTGLAILLVYKGEVALIIILCGVVAFLIYAGFKLICKYKNSTIEVNLQGEPTPTHQDRSIAVSPNRRTIASYPLNNYSNQTLNTNIFNTGTRTEILLQPQLLPPSICPEHPPPDYYSVIDERSEKSPRLKGINTDEKADDSLPSYQEALYL